MDKKLNKKRIFIIILVLLIIILSFTSFILYRTNLTIRAFLDEYLFRKNITEGTLPQIATESMNSYAFKDFIVYLNKNVLHFYNKSANELATLDLEISNPIFKSNSKYLCVAQKNGGKLYLIDGKNLLWQKDIEGKINNVFLNKNGYIAVSISDTTYKTICKVFDNNGNELFTSFLSKSYIMDCSISNDNKYVALAEINCSGITIQSNIKILSVDKALANSSDTIIFNYSAPVGDFITNIEYCDSTLVCLYDTHIDVIKDNSVQELTNFSNSKVLFADINNKLVKIEKHADNLFNATFELQIIDVNTLEQKTFCLDKEPKSIKVFGNVIAINFGTEALFINNYCWVIKNYTSLQEIQNILLSNDVGAIVFKDKVEIISL